MRGISSFGIFPLILGIPLAVSVLKLTLSSEEYYLSSMVAHLLFQAIPLLVYILFAYILGRTSRSIYSKSNDLKGKFWRLYKITPPVVVFFAILFTPVILCLSVLPFFSMISDTLANWIGWQVLLMAPLWLLVTVLIFHHLRKKEKAQSQNGGNN